MNVGVRRKEGWVVEENRETYVMTQGLYEINEDAIETIVNTGSGSSVIGRKCLEAV